MGRTGVVGRRQQESVWWREHEPVSVAGGGRGQCGVECNEALDDHEHSVARGVILFNQDCVACVALRPHLLAHKLELLLSHQLQHRRSFLHSAQGPRTHFSQRARFFFPRECVLHKDQVRTPHRDQEHSFHFFTLHMSRQHTSHSTAASQMSDERRGGGGEVDENITAADKPLVKLCLGE